MERELIDTLRSYYDKCKFCTSAHAATVIALGGTEELLDKVFYDPENASVSDKMNALLQIAAKAQQPGRQVKEEDVEKAKPMLWCY